MNKTKWKWTYYILGKIKAQLIQNKAKKFKYFKFSIKSEIDNALDSKVCILSFGNTLFNSQKILLASKQIKKNIFPIIEIAPQKTKNVFEVDKLENLYLNNKTWVIAIGAITLEISPTSQLTINQIEEIFIKQINLANKYHLPIVIKVETQHERTLDLLKLIDPNINVIIQTSRNIKQYADRGYYVSVTNTKEITKDIPFNKIILEKNNITQIKNLSLMFNLSQAQITSALTTFVVRAYKL